MIAERAIGNSCISDQLAMVAHVDMTLLPAHLLVEHDTALPVVVELMAVTVCSRIALPMPIIKSEAAYTRQTLIM